MPRLLLVSLVWALSFGLIKQELAGLDPVAVATLRLALAAVLFTPWLRWPAAGAGAAGTFIAIGAVQFGVMYATYLAAFRHLAAHEVALLTVLTPLYLALIESAVDRRWRLRWIAAALLAVAGAAVAIWSDRPLGTKLTGLVLVQASNLCFALGQVAYRRAFPRFAGTVTDRNAFAWLMLGGLLATALLSGVTTDWSAFSPTLRQFGVIGYLGAVATALGFFLWAQGSVQVNAGVLAAFNNAKVPLGVACSLVVFGESASLGQLALSFVLLAGAVALAAAGARRDDAAGSGDRTRRGGR
ncbi:MAG: EamA family transporter [Verrucomicrobia bacterium]|nr:EamA family transporter [Verrucomicrobiota bacterium]